MNEKDEDKLFIDYLENGGMPYGVTIRNLNRDLEAQYIEGIYNTIFVKDIEEREKRKEKDISKRKITDLPLLKNISKYLSSVIGSYVSINSIADYLTSNGRKTSHVTVGDYVIALEMAYLFYKVERIDVNRKNIFKQNHKYYMVDLGFRKHILTKSKYDFGFSLENIIYFELLRRGYKVNIGKIGEKEIDFVAFKDGKYEYYQLASTLIGEKTFEREQKSLSVIKDNYPKFILTYDKVGLGNYNGIEVINIIDWLLK